MSLGSGSCRRLPARCSASVIFGECNELTLLAALTRRGDGIVGRRIPVPGRRRRCRDEGIWSSARRAIPRPISRSSSGSPAACAPAPERRSSPAPYALTCCVRRGATSPPESGDIRAARNPRPGRTAHDCAYRTAFSPNSGTAERAGPGAARDGYADHGPPASGIAEVRIRRAGGHAAGVSHASSR